MCAECVGAGGVAAGRGAAIERDADAYAGGSERLESDSPEAVLKRGYEMVFHSAGRSLTTVEAMSKGVGIRVRLADGEVRAITKDARGPGGQGALQL